MTEYSYNISKFDHCYGCGVCVISCPVKIISLRQNEDGFYQPLISEQEQCIKCGKCLRICAYNHKETVTSMFEPRGFSAWSNNKEIRLRSTSGGIAAEIIKQSFGTYKICGVVYNASLQRAEHHIADTTDDIELFTGSKYLQSYTIDGFKDIDINQKYIVIGTPCQIDSLRRYIRVMRKEDNFILIDVFCHGVPSRLLWTKYLNEIKNGIGAILKVTWRNKILPPGTSWHGKTSFNWHDSYNVLVLGEKGTIISPVSGGDIFFKFFLGNYCLNECCYKCRYKLLNSAADIRLGDMWGNKYRTDPDGINGAIAFTQKGLSLLNELENVTLLPQSIDDVTEGQQKVPSRKPCIYSKVKTALRTNKTLQCIDLKIVKPYEMTVILFKRILNRIRRMLTV